MNKRGSGTIIDGAFFFFSPSLPHTRAADQRHVWDKMASSARAWRFDLNPGTGEAPQKLARPLGFNPAALIEVNKGTEITLEFHLFLFFYTLF